MTDHDIEQETEEVSTKAEPDNNSVGSPSTLPPDVAPREAYTRELKRDPVTGKFIAGTGSRGYLGGRPRNSRDKITTTMIRLAEETAAEYGQEMFEKLARTDPAACLALITRLLPNADLSKAIEGESTDDDQKVNVTISLVGGNAPTNNRLESPVERLTSPDRDLEMVVPEPSQEPTEAPLSDPVEPVDPVVSEPTQADMDAVAAREARERQERQNEVIRQYGGLTGRKARGSSGNGIEYPEDGVI